MMSKEEIFVSKIIFKNRIYKFDGQQFEDFFIDIMSKFNNNFQSVKPHGRIGDRKNDGFDRTTGTYYQVFSPEDILKTGTIHDAVKKLGTDFTGLYSYWNDLCEIKKYFFVINDKYKGIPAPIIEKSIELESNTSYSHISIDIFKASDLENVFDKLSEIDVQDVVGFIPNTELPIIEFEALNETVQYLITSEFDSSFNDKLIIPDFYEKIQFNNLNDEIKSSLTNATYQEGALMNYFNSKPGINVILQKRFSSLYQRSKIEIPDSTLNSNNLRFAFILESACPKLTLPIKTCVLVLMAYYFTCCDIFEEPVNEEVV